MEWFIIGVILISITIFILKQTQSKIGFNSSTRLKIKIWALILIIVIGLLPIANILAFIIFIFCYAVWLFEEVLN